MPKKLLTLEGVCKYYTSSQSVVMGLNNINVSFERGEFVAITGESGSGKSTLAHVLGGILPYESGEMLYDGSPTSHYDGADYERYRRDNISFISQNYGILVGCTVLENVVSALRLTGMDKEQASEKAEEILKEVELWELRARRAARLSSGQKQRLSIARALAKPAPVLIADEPTGNLDPENSAKVIELLAHAARERLVILITHEFEEASDCVDRHIVIQNGQIVMDAALKPAAKPEKEKSKESKTDKERSEEKKLSTYVSGLQIKGRPVWSSMVLLFFALTAFAVFAFLGTFIVALDDTSTRIYDDSAFKNGIQRRIVAAKLDGDPMTGEDYDKLLGVENVESLERYGYLTDVNYAYRENVDYKIYYNRENNGTSDNPDLSMSQYVSVLTGAPFLRTVPLFAEETAFLTAGRMPENIYEVVLGDGSEDMIGTVMQVYLYDSANWSISALVDMEMTVVGVTDYDTGLFFHDDMGRMFTTYIMGEGQTYMLAPNDKLADDEWRCSESRYQWFMNNHYTTNYHLNINLEGVWDNFKNPEYYVRTVFVEEDNEAGLPPYHSSTFNSFAEVSPSVFETLMWQQNSDQVSLTIEDYAYTDQVLEELHAMGYLAISPFKECSTEKDPELAAERMQTLTVCCAALLAVILLQVIVLRAMFGTQTESYRLFSNIGLTCRTAKLSILWQILFFTVCGQIIGGIAILICGQLGIERIVHLIHYLPPSCALVLFGVHLLAGLAAGLWVMQSVGRQVYPLAGKQSDLILDTEEDAL